MNWLNLFKTKETNPGALIDDRPMSAKALDYTFEETVSAPEPVNWVEKAPTQWKRYSIRNQVNSSSCVGQTVAKMIEIMYKQKTGDSVVFSATPIYRQRANYPREGMIGADALDLAKKYGTTVEEFVPSQNLSEEILNSIVLENIDKDLSTPFKVGGYVMLPIDFETVASTISRTGKGVMVWFRFGSGEWKDIPVVSTQPKYAHSVTAVDFTLYKGQKCIIIEDSWGKFGQWSGQRLITEDFFKARCFFAAYFVNFKYADGEFKPLFDGTVVSLQNILKFEGLFPTNIESTGKFLQITKGAVDKFRIKYNLAPSDKFEITSDLSDKLKQLYSL